MEDMRANTAGARMVDSSDPTKYAKAKPTAASKNAVPSKGVALSRQTAH